MIYLRIQIKAIIFNDAKFNNINKGYKKTDMINEISKLEKAQYELLDEQDDKILNVKIDHIFELMNTKA
jgi:hypothetical protein